MTNKKGDSPADGIWGDGTPWKTEAALWSFIRGILRRGWNKHPIKLNKIKSDRKQVINTSPKAKKPTVWGATCEMCKKDYILKHIEVDHITPAGSLSGADDIRGFVERLLLVTEDDLRLVCVECNSALAYADKHSLSFSEALVHKKVINLCKGKGDATEWLVGRGIKPESNAKKRRQQVYDYLIKQEEL